MIGLKIVYLRTQLIERLGLLSDDILDKAGSPLDTLSNHLAGRLAYGVGERDMILMRHEVTKFETRSVIYLSNSGNLRIQRQLFQSKILFRVG